VDRTWGRRPFYRARTREPAAQGAQPVELIPQLAPVNSKVQPVQFVADAAPLHGNHVANRYVEAAIIIIGIAVGIALLRFAEGFFVPLLMGLLTSYALGPLVSGLRLQN